MSPSSCRGVVRSAVATQAAPRLPALSRDPVCAPWGGASNKPRSAVTLSSRRALCSARRRSERRCRRRRGRQRVSRHGADGQSPAPSASRIGRRSASTSAGTSTVPSVGVAATRRGSPASSMSSGLVAAAWAGGPAVRIDQLAMMRSEPWPPLTPSSISRRGRPRTRSPAPEPREVQPGGAAYERVDRPLDSLHLLARRPSSDGVHELRPRRRTPAPRRGRRRRGAARRCGRRSARTRRPPRRAAHPQRRRAARRHQCAAARGASVR